MEENLFEAANVWGLRWRFTSQEDYYPENTAMIHLVH